MRQKRFRTTGL